MTPPERSGRIEVITGPMFSGKSEELARRVRRALIGGLRSYSFTSHVGRPIDQSDRSIRHGNLTVETRPINRAEEILRALDDPAGVDLVAVNDAHFLGAGLVEVATHLAERGVRLVLAGTDTDFRSEPFGMIGHLLAIAEEVTKLTAVCAICGAPASRTQRLIEGRLADWEMPVVLLGGPGIYQARCRACFVMPRHDEHQVSLL